MEAGAPTTFYTITFAWIIFKLRYTQEWDVEEHQFAGSIPSLLPVCVCVCGGFLQVL